MSLLCNQTPSFSLDFTVQGSGQASSGGDVDQGLETLHGDMDLTSSLFFKHRVKLFPMHESKERVQMPRGSNLCF